LNYVIFDLEYNQQDKENHRLAWTMKTKKPQYLKAEIVQIGAIKVDENLKYISNFKMYVKPKFLPKINQHVLEILNINESYIRMNGLYFNKVFNEFKSFIGQDKCTFVTWSGSDNDINVLKSNLNAWKIKFELNKYKHIDLQKAIMNKNKLKDHPSLKNVALEYGIDFDINSLHDAYMDASVTKQLLQKIGIYEARLYTEDINFRLKRGIDLKSNSISTREFKRIPNCNMCGKFVKTVDKTNFYTGKNKNIIQMNKICFCNKCKIHIFKNYRYEFTTKTLTIQDKMVYKNNSQHYDIMKKDFNYIKNIEEIQLSE